MAFAGKIPGGFDNPLFSDPLSTTLKSVGLGKFTARNTVETLVAKATGDKAFARVLAKPETLLTEPAPAPQVPQETEEQRRRRASLLR